MGNLELQGVVAVTDEEYIWRLEEEVERLREYETWLKLGHEAADGFLDGPLQTHIVDKVCIIGHERDELRAEVKQLRKELNTEPTSAELSVTTPAMQKLARLAREYHGLAKELLAEFDAYRSFVHRQVVKAEKGEK